jgi:hypothetical protein
MSLKAYTRLSNTTNADANAKKIHGQILAQRGMHEDRQLLQHQAYPACLSSSDFVRVGWLPVIGVSRRLDSPVHQELV